MRSKRLAGSMTRLRSADIGWVVAALLPVIAFLPTIRPGLGHVIDGADGPFQVHRIYTMSVMLEAGHLWPRWVPYYHLGFGYPIFDFYPPGVSYLGGIMVLGGASPAAAFNLVTLLSWIIGSMGTYALARDVLPAPGAILAAMLWSYAPSRLTEVWFQGGLAQMMAAALVPWLFHGPLLTAHQPTRRHLLAIALPLAGIALTHLPILYIAVLFGAPTALLAPVWASRGEWRTLPRRWLGVGAGLLLGAGLAAIFLAPMALELRYIRASQENAETVSYLESRFLELREVFSQPGPVDLTDINPPVPKTLGLMGGLLGLAGLIGLVVRRRYALALALAAALAVTVFMLLDRSLDVWLAIPDFRQLRFPERFLRFGALWLALLGGASLLLLPDRWQEWGLLPGLVLVLGSALPLSYGTGWFVDMHHLTALDEINFELTTYIWGTTSYDEYDPIWGERIPLPGEVPEPEQYITDPLRIVPYRLDTIRRYPDLQTQELNANTIRITLTSPSPVRFHQYYFPGWTATLDGKPVRVYPETEMGLLTVDMPAGEHVVRLRYTGTGAQRTGAAITLLSLGIAAGLVIHRRAAARGDASPARTRLSRRVGLAAGGGAAAFALVSALIITPHTRWFRTESPPDAPSTMRTPVHQPFGDAFELLGYTLRGDHAAPGGKLAVTLYWRPLHSDVGAYTSRVQVVNLALSEAWAVSEQPFPHGGKGYTPDRFTSDVHTLKLFPWAPPYVGHLSVQLLDSATREPLRLPDGSDRLLLDPLIRLQGRGPGVANALHYSLGGEVELRCASVVQNDQTLAITLYWHVTRAPGTDLTVLMHGLDSGGMLIAQNDAPPLGQNYPARYWRPGQTLVDQHTLPASPALDAV
ncbi:MAG TPA: 6-pyruvoyl-tetrahydropterin synthase-related protein, partial [Aggregatilineaceae bacterium]|nr:6-pyruvoyl-tetrahydropterin synthase-related protein [Aggregatilineaceae bacterium]